MISKSDLQKISGLPIEQVADALGLTVKRHWSLCPFHSDSHPSLYYRVAANKYRCFVCGGYGGPIDLTRHINNQSFHDAVCWLAQTFGIAIDTVYERFRHVQRREVKPVRKEPVHLFDPSTYLPLVAQPVLTDEARRFLFDQRKLDPRVIRWCAISSTRDHLLIPYFGVEGNLIGMQWRYLGQDKSKPRFRFPRGSQCGIYNLQVLSLLKEGEPLFVCEGASDCWAMLSSGHKAIGIPSATLLKPQDLQMLSTLSTRLATVFHMYPDQDEPGERLFLQLRRLLGTRSIVRHQLPPDCKDYSEYYMLRH